jgi:UDP-2,3-diacylglucosamine hydrolase
VKRRLKAVPAGSSIKKSDILLVVSLYVVSDLHISGAGDPLYSSLLALLHTRAQSGDTVVLAGDIFDVFVGPKKVFVSEYDSFIGELRAAAARGVKIHYIEGNHDFQLKRVFASVPGIRLHTESVAFELGEKRFFVAHGDLADHTDYGYRLLRGILRSPPLKAAIRVAPGKLVERVGRKMAKKSSQYTRRDSEHPSRELPIEKRERLRTTYRSYAAEKLAQGYDFVVMGHCHDLDEKTFTIGGRFGQYMNVGYPRVHGSYVAWHPGDQQISRERLP